MRLFHDSPIRMPDQTTPSPRRVTGRERFGPNLIHAIKARFFASESLPRLVEGIGVEACLTAAASEHSSFSLE